MLGSWDIIMLGSWDNLVVSKRYPKQSSTFCNSWFESLCSRASAALTALLLHVQDTTSISFERRGGIHLIPAAATRYDDLMLCAMGSWCQHQDQLQWRELS